MKWFFLLCSFSCFGQLPVIPWTVPQNTSGCFPTVNCPTYRFVASDMVNGAATNWVDRISAFPINMGNYVQAPIKNANGVHLSYVQFMTNITPSSVKATFLVFYRLTDYNQASAHVFWGNNFSQFTGPAVTPNIAFYNVSSGTDYGPTVLAPDLEIVVFDGVHTCYTNGVASTVTSLNFPNYQPISLGLDNGSDYNGAYLLEHAYWSGSLSSNDCFTLYSYATNTYGTTRQFTLGGPNWTNQPSVSPTYWLDADQELNQADSTVASYWHSHGISTMAAFNSSSTPVWSKTGGPNGHAAMLFGGAGVFYNLTTTYTNPCWYFVVCQNTNLSPTTVVIDGGSFGQNQIACASSNIRLFSRGALSISAPWPGTNWILISAKFNGASSLIRTNTVQAVTGNVDAGFPGSGAIQVGQNNGGGNNFQGNVAEYLMFHADLVSNDVYIVENYLTNKYALHP